MKRLCNPVSVLALCCLVLGLACKAATPESTPVSLTDDLGRTVTLESVPKRIVSLAPSNTEILFALGLDNEVVGVTDYCDYPPAVKEKPSVGAPFPEFNLEKIISLNPDLAVAQGYTLPDIVSKLEAQGIPVIVLGTRTVDGVIANIELLGKVTGKEAKAKELVKDMEERVDAVTAKTKDASKPRVYYEIDATDPTKPWTAGPGSLMEDIIHLAGGENIGAKGPSEAYQISGEEILRANPEIIIFASAQYGVSKADIGKRTGWEAISAVQEDAIYPVDAELADLIEIPGPRIVEGVERMAQIVHPELFQGE